jgi:tRNA (guanine37-N1)-methyltransferase
MKIDVISIFPEYLTPLNLSLLGKAQSAGLVEIEVHNLRDQAVGVHGSVDDTPYGGGAGMVMSPEVWGKAQSHLIFACGRYEGIDDRIRQYYSQPEFQTRNIRVHEYSIGDYVLGGGEVASMVMIEAITRLIPGVLGNPESLAEESHNSEGYLEYPNFTKPAQWRGIDVPEILLSGNHAAIAKWRAEQAQLRAQKNR